MVLHVEDAEDITHVVVEFIFVGSPYSQRHPASVQELTNKVKLCSKLYHIGVTLSVATTYYRHKKTSDDFMPPLVRPPKNGSISPCSTLLRRAPHSRAQGLIQALRGVAGCQSSWTEPAIFFNARTCSTIFLSSVLLTHSHTDVVLPKPHSSGQFC